MIGFVYLGELKASVALVCSFLLLFSLCLKTSRESIKMGSKAMTPEKLLRGLTV